MRTTLDMPEAWAQEVVSMRMRGWAVVEAGATVGEVAGPEVATGRGLPMIPCTSLDRWAAVEETRSMAMVAEEEV